MFNFLRKLRRKVKIPDNNGWIPDPIKQTDYRIEELFAALPAFNWRPLVDPKPLFPMKQQDGSSSCVCQSISKALGVLEYYENGGYRDLSPRFIYAQRPNTPQAGMIFRDGLDIAIKQGAPLESLLPSYGKGETEMNGLADLKEDAKQIAQVYKGKNYAYCDSTFDTIASLLEQKVPVVIGIKGSNAGWSNPPNGIVRPPRTFESIWYHGLVIVPEGKNGKNCGIINGKKAFVFDNSWGDDWALNGQGIITEDYPILWNYNLLNLPDNWRDAVPESIAKPKHRFDVALGYGMKNNPEVVLLQQALKWLGMFPKDTPMTGNYYSITSKAVETFQTTYGISVNGNVGIATMAKLSEIFG